MKLLVTMAAVAVMLTGCMTIAGDAVATAAVAQDKAMDSARRVLCERVTLRAENDFRKRWKISARSFKDLCDR